MNGMFKEVDGDAGAVRPAPLPPLVLDLDGTLLRSDLLVESLLGFIRLKPWHFLAPLWWLLSGKAYLKSRLAEVVRLDVATLPYDPEVLALATQEHAKGRKIVLATASHRRYADEIAAHLKFIDVVLATEQGVNLSSTRKRDRLTSEFGSAGFDYAGNSKADLPVWQQSRRAYVVNPDPGVEAKAQAIGNVERVIVDGRPRWRLWAQAMRLHQWAKNLLLFVPLFASHQIGRPEHLVNGLIAFLCFGLCASGVYLINDLLDLADDRQHAYKRNRPFASGALPIKSGLLAIPWILVGAFGLAVLLPWQFAGALAVYFVITLLYSVALKRMMMVDVVTLAALYTVRIIAGTFAFSVVLTFWMLAFSMFMFLSLALVKRYSELREARSKGKTGRSRGRGYFPDDLEMIAPLGAAAGYIAVMVLALYIQDQSTTRMYRYPRLIWLACPILLLWISRTWMLSHRGKMHDDPVVFALKDRFSLLLGALFGAIFWLAA